MKVELKRVDNAFHFVGRGSTEITVDIDGSKEIGASEEGVRPMELILMGLGSCGAMDIISILKKQRQALKDVKIIINGNRDYNQTPAVFTDIFIEFVFIGTLNEAKVKKAVTLSMDKYCSVSAMLEKSANISYSYKIIEG